MRTRLTLVCCVLLLATVPALAQRDDSLYRIEKGDRPLISTRDRQGKPALYVTVQFKVIQPDGKLADNVTKDEIVVEEDGRRVAELEIYLPSGLDRLTTMLAMDISGSMSASGKMAQAKQAAQVFLDQLHAQADCGLLFFDHQLRPPIPPAGDPARLAVHRAMLRGQIEAVQPGGGTAWIDATAKAIEQLRGVKGRRAVVVMTDGVDLNSQRPLADVIRMAKTAEVPVYTVGVGEPGKKEELTTVLVLDKSGSMEERADRRSRLTKMEALKEAGSRFIDLMRPTARTTLLPFSTEVERPEPFSAEKITLKNRLRRLDADGDTALFDAVHDGLETLIAARPSGKRAVVVLSDGMDNRSHHRVEEVVRRARRAEIPLHVLGFGQKGELDDEALEFMARETGGSYHHARSAQELSSIFENLSIQLHDDGIDEEALKQLAHETGGKYYEARDVSKLQLIYRELAQELQETYTVTFPSYRQSHDGTARDIEISVIRNGLRVSEGARFGYNVRGVVVPEMDQGVYLFLLVLLGSLLALPAGVRRIYRFYGGQ
jgi:VWFA-related protein